MSTLNKRYTHYKKGEKYAILSERTFIQEDGVWVPAILYTALADTTKSFVRSREEFFEKFSEIREEVGANE